MKTLQPDLTQQELATEINANLSSDAHVTFFRKEDDDGHMHYGIIYEYGSARHVMLSPNPYYDPDRIVAAVNKWIAQLGRSQRWSTTP